MPLTVITMTNCTPSLRGDLTKWMQEIATGVYVGNFNGRVREELWKRIEDSAGNGAVTMSFASGNEIGYDFKTIHSRREVVYLDGLPLVRIPSADTDNIKHGFINAAHFHNAGKFSNVRHKRNINISPDATENNFSNENAGSLRCANTLRPARSAANSEEVTRSDCRKDHIGKINKNFVVIDFETTGLDSKENKIIEIGAVKFTDGKIEEFQTLINVNCAKDADSADIGIGKNYSVTKNITQMTGITNEMLDLYGVGLSDALPDFLNFIGSLPIVGYNVFFDLAFLKAAILSADMQADCSIISDNAVFDVMRFVKKDKMFLRDYKLETVLREYGIAERVLHRALPDARLTSRLVLKIRRLLNLIP